MNDITRQTIIMFLYLSICTTIGLLLVNFSGASSKQVLMIAIAMGFLTPFCEFVFGFIKELFNKE